ncbi:glutamate--cysteine ligase [Streptomyces sp. NPDC091272]|uniref:carboxylate-amine ligase n=1 Tax=Streptomyces sp. NPDC091272 TaxID=3365981 RepID=UPI00382190D7
MSAPADPREPGLPGSGAAAPTMGVEEEFLLADRRTRRTVPKASAVMDATREVVGAAHVELEFSPVQLETVSAVCADAQALEKEITRLRGAAAAQAQLRDCFLVAAGAPVLGDPGPPPVQDRPRYGQIHQHFGPLGRDQCVGACHVHIGVDDPEEAVRVVNHLRVWAPLLLALSANSPFWNGSDTGYASWRTLLWDRWPSSGPPPVLESAEHYESIVSAVVRSGAAMDPAMIYWQIRPSRHVPTVEVRVADVMPEVADTVAYALLVRALVSVSLDRVREGRPAPGVPETVLRAASWCAARHGMTGSLLDTCRPEALPVPAWQLADSLMALVEPRLTAWGDLRTVSAWLLDLRERGTGATRQRTVAARHGRLEAVVDALRVGP